MTVHRIWQAFGLQPHRQKGFKLSTDPFFFRKLRDIVGLYLTPPQNAVVLYVDEKSQNQLWSAASPCNHSVWDISKGNHDYLRHGTTTLFAALDMPTALFWRTAKNTIVIKEYPSFLKTIEHMSRQNSTFMLLWHNYATHNHDTVKRWIARHPRWHVHHTQRTHRGLIRLKYSSILSPNKRFDVVRSEVSKN